MSLKAIDNQVMVTRTADQAREMANQANKEANAQVYQSAQARAQGDHDTKSVAHVEEGYQPQMKNDREGSGGGGGSGDSRQKSKLAEDVDPAQLPAGFSESIIDIKI